MRQTNKHVFFYGTFLSNWYDSHFEIDWVSYHSSEHYFMAKKASYFGDYETFAKILATDDPKEAKALGRTVKNFDADLWSRVSEKIMYRGVYEKFYQNPIIRKQLLNLSTKKFVEASPYDKIWGIGLGMDNEDIFDENLWKGQNLLGKVLDQVAFNLKDFGY